MIEDEIGRVIAPRSESGSESSVTLVILNFNRFEDTEDCVDSVLKSDFPGIKIVVIDNGSEGNDADMIESRFKSQVELIRFEKNCGVAHGWNEGLRLARDEHFSEFVFLLNNDTIIDSTVIGELVKFARSSNWAGAIGPTILRYESPHKNEFWRLKGAKAPIAEHRLSGSALMLRMRAVDEIGYFDEDFFAYGEENDYLMRMKSSAWTSFYVPTRGKVYHKGSATSSGIPGFEAYHRTRNALIMYAKNIDGASLCVRLGAFFVLWLPGELTRDFISSARHERISSRRRGLHAGIEGYKRIRNRAK